MIALCRVAALLRCGLVQIALRLLARARVVFGPGERRGQRGCDAASASMFRSRGCIVIAAGAVKRPPHDAETG